MQTITDFDEAARGELLRRSEAHRRNPAEAVPLDEALDEIEQSLQPGPGLSG
jgi:hypothetical protein